jgi:hypothetical protein
LGSRLTVGHIPLEDVILGSNPSSPATSVIIAIMQEKESLGAKFRSVLRGIAFIGGALNSTNPYEGLSLEDADAKALRSDWETVGDDMRTAIGEFQESITPTHSPK